MFSFKSTEYTIRVLERVLKANIKAGGLHHLNGHPTLFVINHFTRVETFLVPYIIYKCTSSYVRSLASHTLFTGKVGDLLTSLGVVSTSEPNRDRKIIGDLMCDRSDWLIYPEGLMVKNKKNLSESGKFIVDTLDKIRPPHTGAAVLALKSEIYKRRYLEAVKKNDHNTISKYNKWFKINSIDELCKKSTVIIPVTISYYPLRPGANFIKGLVKRLFKELPPRVEEELEIEGNLLFRSSDIDIYFDRPVFIDRFVAPYFWFTHPMMPFSRSVEKGNFILKTLAFRLTRSLMHQIYTNLEINIDHLFCSGLYQLKDSSIATEDYHRALYLAVNSLKERNSHRIHSSISGKKLISLLIDEQASPIEDIKTLADSLRILDRHDGQIFTNKNRLYLRHGFHTIRLKNPIKVIANELEPSQEVVRVIRQYVNTDSEKLKKEAFKSMVQYDLNLFHKDYQKYYDKDVSKSPDIGSPFLLTSRKPSIGIVLSHGLLSAPEEVRPLANYLNSLGFTVYGVRLRGHGTAPINLETVSWRDWYYSFLRGYAVLKNCCEHIVFGGFSTGGVLALLAAATRSDKVKGVFTINSPIHLKYINARKAVAVNFWNDLLKKINISNGRMECIKTEPENPDINYDVLYLKGLRELKKTMANCASSLNTIKVPSLIVQAKNDPVVHPNSARKLYSRIKLDDKVLRYTEQDRHVIVRGRGCERVFFMVREFLDRILPVSG